MASTASMTSLDGLVQWGLDGGRVMMDARKMVALSSVMVASMANLARVFASIRMKLGWRKMVEAISGACAQGAISVVVGESSVAEDEEQVPVFVSPLC